MAKKRLTKGIFITFEGPEGCGKSTQGGLLYDYLRRRAYPCVHTREPGGTALGERVRRILLNSKDISISAAAELFLFEACRAELVKETILPNLEKKSIVICDRFSDETFSYQGYGGGIPIKVGRKLDEAATGGVKPDLTVLLDIDTARGLERARKKGVDRIERKEIAYHKRVRAGYLELAKAEPGRIKVIKVTGGIQKIQDLVRSEVELVIQRYKRPG